MRRLTSFMDYYFLFFFPVLRHLIIFDEDVFICLVMGFHWLSYSLAGEGTTVKTTIFLCLSIIARHHSEVQGFSQ